MRYVPNTRVVLFRGKRVVTATTLAIDEEVYRFARPIDTEDGDHVEVTVRERVTHWRPPPGPQRGWLGRGVPCTS